MLWAAAAPSGRGRPGAQHARCARHGQARGSAPARLSACSPRGRPRLTRAPRVGRDCAGTTPTRVTGRGSGTAAKKPRGGRRKPSHPGRLLSSAGVWPAGNWRLEGGLRCRLARLLIFVHSGANRSEEELFANLIEQSEPLQLVLYGVFEFGEAQSCPGTSEHFIQF